MRFKSVRLDRILLVCLLAMGGVLAAHRARSEGDESRAGPGASSGVQWVRGYEQALAKARARKQIVLAYACLDAKTCPPCGRLERRVFDIPAAAALNERCVPLRLLPHAPGHGADLARAEQYRVAVFPTLLLLSPDGDLLRRQHAHLYPPYGADAKPMAGTWDDEITVPDLLDLIDEATRTWHADEARLVALAEVSGPAALHERARILAGWARFDEARAFCEAALRVGASASERAAIAETLAACEAPERAAAVLRGAANGNAGDGDVLAWRVRAMELDPPGTPGAIEALLGAVREAGRECLALRLAVLGTQTAYRAGDLADGNVRLEGLWRPDPATWACLDAGLSWELMQLEMAHGVPARARAYAESLLQRHPTSLEAQRVKHGLLDLIDRAGAPRIDAPASPSEHR